MRHEDLKTLQANAKPLPPGATKGDILRAVANLISTIGPSIFKSLRNVEHGPESALRQAPIAGTVIEPIAAALGAMGRETGTNVGSVMDEVPLTRPEVNALACECANGHEMTASRAATNLRDLAARQ